MGSGVWDPGWARVKGQPSKLQDVTKFRVANRFYFKRSSELPRHLTPVQAGPDFGGEGDEGEGVLELEGPFGGFVAEEAHAEQAAGPAAHGTEQAEKRFRYARAGAGGAPFVVAEG